VAGESGGKGAHLKKKRARGARKMSATDSPRPSRMLSECEVTT
jgi:hypothetical protein